MSTKTTLKRIALVAVSALGLGVLASAPSNAAISYRASFSGVSTTASLLPGFTAGSLGTVQINLAAEAGYTLDTAGTDDFATLTMTVNTALDAEDTALLALLDFIAPSTTTFNDANNGILDLTVAKAAKVTVAADGYTSAAAQFRLKAKRPAVEALIAAALPGVPTAVDLAAANAADDAAWAAATGGKVKFTLSSEGAGTAGLSTLPVVLTATFGDWIPATSVTSPVAGVSTVASGGTASYTFTQPYTAVASSAKTAASTFNLSGTVVGAGFAVTAAATGGTAVMIRNSATQIQSNLLKDGNTGAYSVTYTITVTAPATATDGQTIIVNGFQFTVFGGQAWNGTLSSLTREGAASATNGWLAGTREVYAPATAGNPYASKVTFSTGLTNPTQFPAWTFTMSGVGAFNLDGGASRNAYVAVQAGAAAGTSIYIFGDGRPGIGTLTITANGNVVAIQVVNFYGPAASIKVTPVYTIVRAGNGLIGYNAGTLDKDSDLAAPTCAAFAPADCIAVVDGETANDPALVVEVLDALGTRLPVGVANAAGAVNMVSSNTAIVSNAVDSFLDAGVSGKTAGVLLNHVNYSSVATAKSGDSATLTFSYINSLGATLTATQKVTVGGTRTGGTVTMTLDKATYSPGERMVLTVTGKDSSGNPVHDNAPVGALNSNKSVQGLATGSYYGGSYVLGDDAGEDLFAPAASGSFDIILYTGTAAGASIKVSATVGDDAATAAATAAADAALEAIDAANAATDAANLAAEAADAATVAAEEARDAADAATAAVEALASEVAALIASLKAQITTLANTVAKIAKKIKA